MVSKAYLSPDGPELSELIYGTWRILDAEPAPSPAEIVERFEACLELGINTIDTAEIYGGYRVEEAIERFDLLALGGSDAHERTLGKTGVGRETYDIVRRDLPMPPS